MLPALRAPCLSRIVRRREEHYMAQLRSGDATDIEFLEEMLFEAFFWDADRERPSFAGFRDDPEFTKLLKDWGRNGDRAIIAEDYGVRLGAGWFRLWTGDCHSYGFVDTTTPELAIAVRQDQRSKGLGRRLLEALVQTARADGFARLSLSVSPRNPARRLYESAGFRKVGESGTSWTLLLSLGPSPNPTKNSPNLALHRMAAPQSDLATRESARVRHR
jgi:ribosomal protein S18 acetylase RimI-like enzyme